MCSYKFYYVSIFNTYCVDYLQISQYFQYQLCKIINNVKTFSNLTIYIEASCREVIKMSLTWQFLSEIQLDLIEKWNLAFHI